MHSLFSRSRTFSTPKRPSQDGTYPDEFGNINGHGSSKAVKVPSSSTSKKDKKFKSKGKNNGAQFAQDPPEFTVPDGSFLTLNLDPQRYEPGDEPSQERQQLIDYGYLSHRRNAVLGLEEVSRLVDVVGHELSTRGLTTPFIFSTLALDVSASAVRRLIDAFLKMCEGMSPEQADRQWREEAKLAGPHELGMCLRWGLARVVRIIGGQEVRGLLSYETYLEWRADEAEQKYPQNFFGTFIAPLNPLLRHLLVGLLTLLTKFTAHSSSSGHTPPTLSPLFGPLLFGLGPSTLAFHHVYVHYLRATIATEHLMLAFIRWQYAPDGEGSSGAGSSAPTRLKAWIQGYPAMLPKLNSNERPQPRRGARTTRVVSVRRNVRMYSADLVKTAASWGQRPRSVGSTSTDRSFAASKEWERISLPRLKLLPRYSDGYRKRMDLPANFHPDMGAGSSASGMSSAPSLTASVSTSSTASSFFEDKDLLSSRTPEDRFRSLTDLKWGEFELMGFGDLGTDEKKLQFDLTEGARAARAAKRATLSWQDFSSAGFSRTDAPLHATLQFSTPVANTINSWPAQSAEIHRKLKKTQKALPSFGWDTEPVMGSEEVIEEAFIDVFCDLVYGGGWMDVERMEEVDRDCSWALVEFKSLPVSSKGTVSGTSDPRTSSTLILFEEFVPLEYRQQLRAGGSSRRRLPLLFGTSSRKQWKPAATLNGRPYVVGHVPRSPSYREVEFEGLLSSNGSVTKVLTLQTPDRRRNAPSNTSALSPLASTTASPIQTQPVQSTFLTPTLTVETPMKRTSSRSSENNANGSSSRPETPNMAPVPLSPVSMNSKRSSRFRLPLSPPSRTAGLPPAGYENVDFEARLASFDDDDVPATSRSRGRRAAKEDAWVDILVASNSRRLDGQDAQLRTALMGGKSDPELASQEVSEVLAAVRGQLPLDDEDDEGMEPVHEDDRYSGRHETATEGTSEGDRDTLPGQHTSYETDEDDTELPLGSMTLPKRGLGYFDIHPDRRTQIHDDADDVVPGPSQPVSQPQLTLERTSAEDPRELFERPSLEVSEESAYDDVNEVPEPVTLVAPAPPPKTDMERSYSPSPNRLTRNIPEVTVLPPAEEPIVTVPKPSTSKTASLIEMYRERERSTLASSTAVPASKLPIRTGASLVPNAPARERSQSPRSRSPAESSPSVVSVELDDSLMEPRRTGSEDPLFASLNRYVHGAPLHNVLEEEEEED